MRFFPLLIGRVEIADVSLERPTIVIEVDGGVKPQNAARVREQGAQILVAGTAVFRCSAYAEAIAAIRGS